MRITAFDDLYPLELSTGATLLASTSGSNSGTTGGDVTGGSGELSVVGLASTVSLSSNLATGVVLGDVLTIIQASPALARFATPSNTGAAGSNAVTRTLGGQETVVTVAASGASRTLNLGGGNVFDVTLSANCTLAFSGVPTGVNAGITLILRQDGSGNRTVTWPGSVVWPGGSAPTLETAASAVDVVTMFTVDAGTTWFAFAAGGGGGSTSPLTTKGDLWTYSTLDARLGVGSDGTTLLADSTQTTGIRWATGAAMGELLMADGVTSPPVPIETEAGDDWLYADL